MIWPGGEMRVVDEIGHPRGICQIANRLLSRQQTRDTGKSVRMRLSLKG
jgi:hypothetical protein